MYGESPCIKKPHKFHDFGNTLEVHQAVLTAHTNGDTVCATNNPWCTGEATDPVVYALLLGVDDDSIVGYHISPDGHIKCIGIRNVSSDIMSYI